jgi:hypothetical protein
MNPVGCVFSEYSLQNPKAFEFITPILAENEGWAAFIYTPRGKNHGHKLYLSAKANPKDYYCELLTVDDTGAIPLERIERDIRIGDISKEMAQQEYWCSFDYGMEGSILGDYIRTARAEGKLGVFKHDPEKVVYTFWDLGISGRRGKMDIWFGQDDSGEGIRMIDFMEEYNKGLDWFAKELPKKGYKYGAHFAPHDANKRSIVDLTSVVESARKLGIDFEVVQKTTSEENDIELARRMFSKFSFDEAKCSDGLAALMDFRRDKETGKPVQDWTNDAWDAFRTAVRAIELGLLKGARKRIERGKVKLQEKTIMDYNVLEGAYDDDASPENPGERFRSISGH